MIDRLSEVEVSWSETDYFIGIYHTLDDNEVSKLVAQGLFERVQLLQSVGIQEPTSLISFTAHEVEEETVQEQAERATITILEALRNLRDEVRLHPATAELLGYDA